MNELGWVGVFAGLGLAGAGAAAYFIASGQPVSITLAPTSLNNNTAIVSVPRRAGQTMTVNLPTGGTWRGITVLAPNPSGPGSTKGTYPTVPSGSNPFTYTMNATDISVVAQWTLNGTNYNSVLKFS